ILSRSHDALHQVSSQLQRRLSVVVVRTIRMPLRAVKPRIEKNFKKFKLLIPVTYSRCRGAPQGLSKAKISGFNTPMPEFLSIYPKVNPF
ncbi:TPA: hypothetical protein ACKP22_005239, partial [Pseudomonas putida]